MIILNTCGLVEKLFGMEILTGWDRAFLLSGPFKDRQVPVITYLKMDAPDDLELFRTKVANHFGKFKRFRSILIPIGNDFFLKEAK